MQIQKRNNKIEQEVDDSKKSWCLLWLWYYYYDYIMILIITNENKKDYKLMHSTQ